MKVIAILALLSVTFGASSLESIQRNDFGRHLFETIELQMQLGGDVDNVIRLIEKLRDSIVDEQTTAETNHGDFQDACDTKIQEHNDEIDAQTAKKNNADAVVNDLGPKKSAAEDDMATATADRDNKVSEQDAASARRQAEASAHTLALEDYDSAIAACVEAVRLVTENLLTTGFLQTGQRSPVMIEMTKHVAAVRKVAPSYAGLVKALVQLSTEATIKADQGMISRLIDLIEKLKTSLENAKAKDIQNEEILQADYDTEQTALQTVIDDLNVTITTHSDNIATWGPQITDAQASSDSAAGVIETETTLLNDEVTSCTAEQTSYEEETTRRNDERDICQEAIDLLVREFTGMHEEVMEAVGGSELPTTSYEAAP